MFEVYDRAASIAFYRDVLGFEVIAEYRVMWCRLRWGAVELMLNTAYDPGEEPAERVRGHRDASLWIGVASPEAVYERLRAHDWPAEAPRDMPYGLRVASTHDPDGFALHFTCPSAPA
jgi:uncharacterized glyoxalase superfamily protein PhnB